MERRLYGSAVIGGVQLQERFLKLAGLFYLNT